MHLRPEPGSRLVQLASRLEDDLVRRAPLLAAAPFDANTVPLLMSERLMAFPWASRTASGASVAPTVNLSVPLGISTTIIRSDSVTADTVPVSPHFWAPGQAAPTKKKAASIVARPTLNPRDNTAITPFHDRNSHTGNASDK